MTILSVISNKSLAGRSKELVIFLFSIALFGCNLEVLRDDPYVLDLKDGRFVFDFKRYKVDQRGVGRKVAVENYIFQHELVPKECANGIEIMWSGDTENGYGFAVFKCR